MSDDAFPNDVAILGGCGHVGLPLGIAFADRGARVVLYDIDENAVKLVNDATMPFREDGADEKLVAVVNSGLLRATTDEAAVSTAENVVIVVGTPVDEYLNPDPHAIPRAIRETAGSLVDGQLLVLRSTVYPGATALVERLVAELAVKLDVAFCPERIAEGHALKELVTLPQVVAARSERGRNRAAALFSRLTEQIVFLEPEEAELAKLFTNTWRYIKFATANQFFMIANDSGLDFEKIRSALGHDYPRAADLPGAGFAAGPCLFKDTMQLAAYTNNNFALGHAAMLVNEGLPAYIVSRIEQRYALQHMTVAILGMAFKAESDDIRSSLSYKLRRLLTVRARRVLCSDPYVRNDPRLVPLDDAVAAADLIIVATPHKQYAGLKPTVPVVDVWNVLDHGVRV
ncbi:MAG TPA: nucleotide sugar dehydrogenase [Mycobacteriales bacterium]|nr:nucleotide sugar dehydrogenase [Mycobacteriales bacterium]